MFLPNAFDKTSRANYRQMSPLSLPFRLVSPNTRLMITWKCLLTGQIKPFIMPKPLPKLNCELEFTCRAVYLSQKTLYICKDI